MKSRKIIKFTTSLLVLFLLFPPLLSGRQQGTDSSALLPRLLNNGEKNIEKYGKDMFVTTDYGDNWCSITLGYCVYVFGLSNYGENSFENITERNNNSFAINNKQNISSGIVNKLEKAAFQEKNPDTFNPVSTISYLIKITKYINFHISVENGKKIFKVSKSKLTEGLYTIKLDNTGFERSMYYYKLENEKGTQTGKMFI